MRKHPDVDAGWAWTVAVAAGVCHFFTLGFTQAFSGYYVIFLRVFQQSSSLTSWIPSINFGMVCAMGPIASIMARSYGCRVTVFIGGVISVAGFIGSALAQNVITLIITFGFITGIGYGIVFCAAVIITAEYFDKYRVFVVGATLACGGLGNIIFAWIIAPLVEAYGWRWAFAITGALHLHLCAASLVMGRLSIPIPLDCLPDNKQKPDEGLPCLGKITQKFSLRLFTGFNFCTLCLNQFLFGFSMSVVFTHISSIAVTFGLNTTERTMVLSFLGITSLLGRIVLGGIALLTFMNIPLLFLGCYFIAGLSIVFIGMQSSFIGLSICSTMYGFFSAAYGPLLSEVVFMMCGANNFGIGYGWACLFTAIGQIIGAPIAGLIYDLTYYYPASFYTAGTCLMISGLVTLPYAIGKMKCYTKRQAHQVPMEKYITVAT